ncbi:secretoglobin family 3A member 1 [Saccopteryx leptura]|uniref:secretoglobin family 3A member 1 n=1 Tax=Saccopteryx leptura TaxID=249018 RepID=UPI00339CDE05
MKLTTAFLVLCVALLSQCTEAFFLPRRAMTVATLKPAAPTAVTHKPVAPNPIGLKLAVPNPAALTSAMKATAGAMLSPPLLKRLNPLNLLLASLGIPVEHLVEGSRKCVTELGPEAVGAVKALLGVLTFFG